MIKPDVDDLLADYVRGKLADEELAMVETKLRESEALRLRRDELIAYFHAVDEMGSMDAPADFLDKVHARIEEGGAIRQLQGKLFLGPLKVGPIFPLGVVLTALLLLVVYGPFDTIPSLSPRLNAPTIKSVPLEESAVPGHEARGHASPPRTSPAPSHPYDPPSPPPSTGNNSFDPTVARRNTTPATPIPAARKEMNRSGTARHAPVASTAPLQDDAIDEPPSAAHPSEKNLAVGRVPHAPIAESPPVRSSDGNSGHASPLKAPATVRSIPSPKLSMGFAEEMPPNAAIPMDNKNARIRDGEGSPGVHASITAVLTLRLHREHGEDADRTVVRRSRSLGSTNDEPSPSNETDENFEETYRKLERTLRKYKATFVRPDGTSAPSLDYRITVPDGRFGELRTALGTLGLLGDDSGLSRSAPPDSSFSFVLRVTVD